ncbi:MAG TPA: lysylphosphatidylglycerol synthase domain-containing protein [Steroidobacteraceae bacterium]|nr:lysylphosphatidylglycerol synthase domain-containing protein [Steroidobacteraceae bacterium]
MPLQVLPLLLDVLGWRALIERRVRLIALFRIASIRQAINRLLPVANVGGDLVGIRLLAHAGVDGPSAAASVIVELMIALGAQFLFAVAGGACILMRSQDGRVLQGLALGSGVILPAFAAVIIVLRRGRIFSRVERRAIRHLGRWFEGFTAVNQGAALDSSICGLFASSDRLLCSLGWQLAGLVAGSSETWVALHLLGHPVGIAAAIALESLIQAAKSALFMVPAGVGVQEVGLIGIGRWFGLDADVALALSLAKRMREILFGLPALAAWQWIEGRRLTTQVPVTRSP